MLAIITILAVLVFINAPSLLQATGFTQGARFVEDTLNYARENAVNQSVPTVAVVRITGPNAWRRMAIFATPTDGSAWVQVSKWQNLPTGAFIDSTYDPASEGWTSPTSKLSASIVIGPGTQIQDGTTPLVYQTDYYAVGFLVDGSLNNTNNIAIKIIKARLIGGVITADASGDWIKLIIVQVTGHVKDIRKGQ